MLSDIERKALRIIANFSASTRRTPTIRELCVKTGRNKSGIYKALAGLHENQYIEWSIKHPERIVLLEAWERKWPRY